MTRSALVVDDSPYVRRELSRILEKHGVRVAATACNGLEAVKKYKEVRPDFVTLDLVMPEMGGLQALALLKKVDPGAVVIVVSSLSGEDKIAECRRAGASDYIVKPFDEEEIGRVLSSAVPADRSDGD